MYPDLFSAPTHPLIAGRYDWEAHWKRVADAVERAGGREAIASAMRQHGASDSAIERALRNVRVVRALPDEAHDWRVTRANTSNVSFDTIRILPNVAWQSTRGWTGDIDSTKDVLFIDGLVERERSPEELAQIKAMREEGRKIERAQRAADLFSDDYDDDEEFLPRSSKPRLKILYGIGKE